MSNSNSQIMSMLIVALGIFLSILIILVLILFVNHVKKSKKLKKQKSESGLQEYSEELKDGYTREPILQFLEFEKIQDNMIIKKEGLKYLMVVQCQGVNYDLMSQMEKVGVEEGFLQFLNTLRHPIQIYVQTRTVNLNSSIEAYKRKLKEIEDKLNKKETEYLGKVRSEQYSKAELEKDYYELTKQRNLYEYGKDIIYNTEKMSLNQNVLNKQYYIIVSYSPEDLGTSAFDKEEISNMAFSELFTKCQSIIRTLSACSVNGRILNSDELVELLYMAYNRDDAEVFGLDKAKRAGYGELYSTAPDVLDKKIALLNKKIEDEAYDKALKLVKEVRNEKEKKAYNMEKNLDELINDSVLSIVKENESYIGKEISEGVEEKLRKENKKGGKEDVKKEKTTTRRRRKIEQ